LSIKSRFTGFAAVLDMFLQIEVLFATLMIISFIFELYMKSLFKYQIHINKQLFYFYITRTQSTYNKTKST
jgi:hypothetical protein